MKDLSTPIEMLCLSTRPYSCLNRAGINTIGELVERRETLSRIRNCGDTSIREITNALDRWLDAHDVDLAKDEEVEVEVVPLYVLMMKGRTPKCLLTPSSAYDMTDTDIIPMLNTTDYHKGLICVRVPLDGSSPIITVGDDVVDYTLTTLK